MNWWDYLIVLIASGVGAFIARKIVEISKKPQLTWKCPFEGCVFRIAVTTNRAEAPQEVVEVFDDAIEDHLLKFHN